MTFFFFFVCFTFFVFIINLPPAFWQKHHSCLSMFKISVRDLPRGPWLLTAIQMGLSISLLPGKSSGHSFCLPQGPPCLSVVLYPLSSSFFFVYSRFGGTIFHELSERKGLKILKLWRVCISESVIIFAWLIDSLARYRILSLI